MVRLWMHECDRVYRDKLVDEKDMENYDRIQGDISKKTFEVCLESKVQLLFKLFSNTVQQFAVKLSFFFSVYWFFSFRCFYFYVIFSLQFLVFTHMMRRSSWCTKNGKMSLKFCIIIESASQKTCYCSVHQNGLRDVT